MSHRSLPELLSGISLFEGVPRDCIDELIDAGATMHTQPGHVVVSQGSDDAGLQVVMGGSASVEVNGVRRPTTLTEGDYFGEISVIDGGGRSASVIAGDDGLDTFAISPLEFWSIMERQPQLARAMMRHLTARIRELDTTGREGLC
jgi:CRP-like cAMP-binding protein